MNYSTLDKFEGAWFGGIIGSALSNKSDSSDYKRISNYQYPNWIEIRHRIAITLLENRQAKVELQHNLEGLLEEHFYNFRNSYSYQHNSHQSHALFELIPKADLVSFYCRSMSLLLPLSILQDNDYIENILPKTIKGFDLDSVLTKSLLQDIAVWNYILTMVLSGRFTFTEANVGIAIRQLLSSIKIEKSSLVEKLKVVNQAWEIGLSLQQLTKELYRYENSIGESTPTASSAIALSFYCFASTPTNFVISVKRAIEIDRQLSSSIALLTATVSGAYNGRTSIPKSWMRAVERHQSGRLAPKTVQKLYQTWLGVYDLDNLKLLCNSEATTIATPKIFQTRSSLKIISQKSTLD